MTDYKKDPLWGKTWEIYYKAYFQERASEALIQRWTRFNLATGYLTAATASGSAIAGWWFWTVPGWKSTWVTLTAFASLLAFTHTHFNIANRLKLQEELFLKYGTLRLELEEFRSNLELGLLTEEKKVETFKLLQRKYLNSMIRKITDMAYTLRFRKRVQSELNQTLGVAK